MICQRCLLRLGRQQIASSASSPSALISRSSRSGTTTASARQVRQFTPSSSAYLATPVTAQTTTATNPRPNDQPAATSTSAAQPFSTPLTLSSSPTDVTASTPARPPSSATAGTVLKGLNFLKNGTDPVAKEDHEYPDWLWRALDKKTDGQGAGAGEGDLFSKSKKQRRLAAKALRKQMALGLSAEDLAPKVPIYQQTIDLPSGDSEGSLPSARDAANARAELNKAMRNQRRAQIKETNFLKKMQ